jgi:hypothetical protein
LQTSRRYSQRFWRLSSRVFLGRYSGAQRNRARESSRELHGRFSGVEVKGFTRNPGIKFAPVAIFHGFVDLQLGVITLKINFYDSVIRTRLERDLGVEVLKFKVHGSFLGTRLRDPGIWEEYFDGSFASFAGK